MAADDVPVRYDVAGPVATLTLDSPRNRNALSRALMTELDRSLATAITDRDVRVIVISHTGGVFCSGMDLHESARADANSMPVRMLAPILQTVYEAPKPVIARVGGPARAGGIGLAAACDIALAVADATFAFTEVRLGLVPAVITAVLQRRMAPRPLAELLLTGEVFDARKAAEIGLLNGVAEDAGALDAEVARYARLVCAGAPQAVALTKRLLHRPPVPVGRDLAELVERSAERFAADEAAEGMAAAREKRPPRWAPAD